MNLVQMSRSLRLLLSVFLTPQNKDLGMQFYKLIVLILGRAVGVWQGNGSRRSRWLHRSAYRRRR